MKHLFFLMIVFLSFNSFAQTPHLFKYQAAIRNSEGEILSEQQVSLKISIVKDEINGEVVYSEVHSTETNKNGLVTLEIGAGTADLGGMQNIDWSNGLYFIKTEIDVNGGTNFDLISASQLLSVPYSLYSQKAAFAEKSGDTIWSKMDNNIYINEGFVGVGNSTPSAKVHVTEKVNYDSQALLQVEDGSAMGSYLRMKDGSTIQGQFNPVLEGNGIGTGSPDRTGLWLWGRLSEDGSDDRGMGFRVYNSSGGKIFNAPLYTWFNQNEEIMRVSSGGKLGIGTSNPLYEIDVAGQVNANRFLINGEPLSSPDTVWYSKGQNIYYNKGYVGISTVNPMYDLDVNGQVNANEFLINGEPLDIPDSVWSSQEENIYFNNGYVGIGTNVPISPLNISNSVDVDGDALLQVEDNTAPGSFLRLKDGSSLSGYFNPVLEGNSIGAGSPDRTGLWLWGRLSEDGSDDRGMGFRVYNNSGGKILSAPLYTWFNQNEEVMRIDADGNVGVGTEAPKSKVQVSGGDIYIEDASNGVIMTSPNGQCWRMTVDDTGSPVFNNITCP